MIGAVWPRRIRLIHLAWLAIRARIRASEIWLIVIAAGVGAVAGLTTLTVRALARGMQVVLFGLVGDQRVSTLAHLTWRQLSVIPLGGLALGLITWLWVRRRPRPIVDPVEANALRGGRMSLVDSLFLGGQSIISNGVGASVGLEAAYAQLGAVAASITGRFLHLRRNDLRTFVGAGAGAGIAAAFGAPLTGAFYAFEIIIGSYSVFNVAPVVAAALAATLVTRVMGVDPQVIHSSVTLGLRAWHYLLFVSLGLVCALFGVLVMRAVALIERGAAVLPAPRWVRPALGGVLLALIAWQAPTTLGAGHGAMYMNYERDLAVPALVLLILSKAGASAVALGFGYRGGLFFASLYLGSLVGRLFFLLLYAAGIDSGIDPQAGALVGMGAMAVAIIGGPFTMSFLVLETTGDFGLTAATLTASIVASVIVRETFGYSFSTWRLHLRGETIRSAHDVGWLRTLTAQRMMRPSGPTVPVDTPVVMFRQMYPLGSARRVIALDSADHYAGIVLVAAVYAQDEPVGTITDLATHAGNWLAPDMAIKEIMRQFDRAESDELVVLSENHELLGVLSEAHATRRYAEELEKARRDLVGEA